MDDWGPLAAQDDKRLMEYFHTTGQVKLLFDKDIQTPNCIFVTRPGGGKTALVKRLKSNIIKGPLIFIQPSHIQLVPPNDKLNLENQRILMQFELYTGIISELLQKEALSNGLKEKCQTYIKDEWGKSIKKFLKEELQGLSIVGFGFSLKESDRRSYLMEIKRNRKIDKVSDLMYQISEKVSPIIVSDDPEAMVTRGFDEVSRENSLLTGAYLSVLTHLHSVGCRVFLFVKEYILQGVLKKYKDSSHFEDRIEGIQWTEEDLMEMLNLRLSKRLGKKWEDIFAVQKEKFQKEVLPYLINGPRDLLFICNSASKSGKKITYKSIQKIICILRDNKWNEISKQFGEQWPSITELAQAVISVVNKKHKGERISRKKFNSIVKTAFEKTDTRLHKLRTKERWINTCLWGRPTLEDRLFSIGCLGYIFEKRKVYPWAGRSLQQFRISELIFINSLFSQ